MSSRSLAVVAAFSLALAGRPAPSAAQLAAPAQLRKQPPQAKLEFHQSSCRALAFSPDGKRLAVGGDDQQISLWDVAERKLLDKGRGHKAEVTAVAFSDDGKTLCSSSKDGTIVIWQVEPLKELRRLKGPERPVECLAVHGKQAFSGAGDGVRVWNLETGQQESLLESPAGAVLSLSVLPKRAWVVAGTGSGKLIVWRKLDAPPLVMNAHQQAVRALAASPDGAWLAAGCGDGKASLWDARLLRKTRVFEAHEGRTEGVAFSPDGRVLAVAGGRSDLSSGYVTLFETPTGAPLAQLDGHKRAPLNVAFSPAGGQLASVGGDQAGLLWQSPIGADMVLPHQREIEALTEKIKAGGLGPDALAALHEMRGYRLAQRERWQDAVNDYNEAARLAPANNMHLLRAGVLAQLAGDARTQRLAAQTLAKLLSNDSNNMYLAERVLKVCALSDPPVGDRDHLTTLAEQSVTRSENLAWGAYHPVTAALMHYRFGQYDKALADVAESRRRNTSPEYRPHLPELMNKAIAALCLTKQGKLKEAADSLADMEQLMDLSRGLPTTAGINMFHDWLTAELLYVEARDLLHERRHAPPKP